MNAQGFADYREQNPHEPLIPWGEYAALLGDGEVALQARINYLESLLAVGFALASDEMTAGGEEGAAAREIVHNYELEIPRHRAVTALVVRRRRHGKFFQRSRRH